MLMVPARNLLTDPHEENRTCRQGDDNGEVGEESRVIDGNAEAIGHADCLDHTKNNGCVAVDLVDLFGALRSFLGPFFQGRDDHGQKLSDDRRIDIRSNAHSKY